MYAGSLCAAYCGLAIAVALCMFFAGTIRTMTTAKVELVTATTGRLGQVVKLKGKLTVPGNRAISLPERLKIQYAHQPGKRALGVCGRTG